MKKKEKGKEREKGDRIVNHFDFIQTCRCCFCVFPFDDSSAFLQKGKGESRKDKVWLGPRFTVKNVISKGRNYPKNLILPILLKKIQDAFSEIFMTRVLFSCAK